MRGGIGVLAAMVLTGGALAPGASARNASRSDTLIGRWVSNSNAAVAPPPLGLFGGARLVRTGSGSALSLNGVGGFARIADRPALDIPPDGAFTLDARVNTLDTGRYQAVVVKATPGGSWSWGILLNPQNQFYTGHDANDVAQSMTVVRPGRWYEVTVTYNAGTVRMYVDGALENTATSRIVHPSGDLFLGRKGGPTGTQEPDYFHGEIQDVSLYGRTLSDTEVARLVSSHGRSPSAPHTTLTSYVDPFVGTSNGGNTYPGATLPFGMTQLSPDTQDNGIGYAYDDHVIHGFSMLHMSGVGCPDYGDVFMTASTGPITPGESAYSSPFNHASETASPGYYRVRLDKQGVLVELAAALRAGAMRLTFPAGAPGNFLLPISHTQVTTDAAHVTTVGNNRLEGDVTSQGFCGGGKPYTVYFVIRFSRPFASSGTWRNDTVTAGSTSVEQTDRQTTIGAFATFAPPARGPNSVVANVGISFVDVAGARRNLDTSIGGRSFDQLRRDAAAEWEQALRSIEVTGGSEAQRTNFYTALYHSLLMPNVFSDADGRVIGFDEKIHGTPAGHIIYANFSGWDIYRTEIPLLSLIQPQRVQDMAQSLVDEYKQSGFYDRWPMANTPTGVMVGEPTTAIQSTIWNYGLHGFDMNTAYGGMLKGIESYFQREAEPRGYSTGNVSTMQEYAYATAALMYLANALHKPDDAARLKTWSEDVFNLFNPTTGFFQPRNADGTWRTPFDPAQTNGYVEGSAWQYLWLVPQDEAGLIRRLGGDGPFNQRMDEFFNYTRPTWDRSHYNPYNEPDLQAPFLYDYSGAPWKTQSRVRELQRDAYFPAPGGIPGNDDCGTMSAWYILSALGLYPVDPSRPIMELTSPLFSRAVVHLAPPHHGRVFTVLAPGNGPETPYVQSLIVNGKPWNRPDLPVEILTNEGTLRFLMGASPNQNWGAGTRPPSLSTDNGG